MPKKLILSFLLCILYLPGDAMAIDLTQLNQDFRSLSGNILLEMDNEYLIDLDTNAGIHIGDIITLVLPARRGFSGLGLKDQPAGYLRVSRVKSGYSYAVMAKGKIRPQPQSKIIRYHRVPARLISSSAKLSAEIKDALDHLIWLEPGSRKQPLLTFILKNNSLSVYDSQGSLLYQYKLGPDRITNVMRPPQPNMIDFKNLEAPGMFKKVLRKINGLIH